MFGGINGGVFFHAWDEWMDGWVPKDRTWGFLVFFMKFMGLRLRLRLGGACAYIMDGLSPIGKLKEIEISTLVVSFSLWFV